MTKKQTQAPKQTKFPARDLTKAELKSRRAKKDKGRKS